MKNLLIPLLILLLSCEKSEIAPQLKECYKGECVYRNKSGSIYMKTARPDRDGSQTVIIYKNSITWLNDSTFIVRP